MLSRQMFNRFEFVFCFCFLLLLAGLECYSPVSKDTWDPTEIYMGCNIGPL